MSEFRHQAATLLRKAQEDLVAARCLGKNPEISPRSIGFNAQQSVEKALKAVLMYHETQYPFTHDIKALIRLVERKTPLPFHAGDLPRLTPFATILRYEVEEWAMNGSLSVEAMLTYAETTVAWARAILGEDEGLVSKVKGNDAST